MFNDMLARVGVNIASSMYNFAPSALNLDRAGEIGRDFGQFLPTEITTDIQHINYTTYLAKSHLLGQELDLLNGFEMFG